MLILSRYPSQAVIVGHDIQIMVIDIVGGRVRLGIIAPREIPVLRQELLRNKDSTAPS
jgi:carbon storage regulator